jgi:purine-binding chemotaxis protein CheW
MQKKTAKTAPTQKKATDWQQIYQKLAEASMRLTDSDELTPDELERAWAKRAELIAKENEEEEKGEQIEVVLAQIGREFYGVEVQYVYDIRPLQTVTRVPRVPAWVAGVVNLRGRIMSVLNLAAYLGLEQLEEAPDRRLLVVETNGMELALLVDSVLAIEPIPFSQIQEAVGAVRGIRAEYVRGLVVRDLGKARTAEQGITSDNEMLVILDLPTLLADPALIVREEVA